MSTPKKIIKYENRKFYYVDEARYVSMLELGDMVAAGERPVVEDYLDGTDITLRTLCRALYERLKHVRGGEAYPFPVASLASLFAKVDVGAEAERG